MLITIIWIIWRVTVGKAYVLFHRAFSARWIMCDMTMPERKPALLDKKTSAQTEAIQVSGDLKI